MRNGASGNTHLLDPLSGKVLRLLLTKNEPMTAAQIAGHLAEHAGLDDAMAELERVGLVQRSAWS